MEKSNKNESMGACIRHLFKAKEMLAMRLCVLHNLPFFNRHDAGDSGSAGRRAVCGVQEGEAGGI